MADPYLPLSDSQGLASSVLRPNAVGMVAPAAPMSPQSAAPAQSTPPAPVAPLTFSQQLEQRRPNQTGAAIDKLAPSPTPGMVAPAPGPASPWSAAAAAAPAPDAPAPAAARLSENVPPSQRPVTAPAGTPATREPIDVINGHGGQRYLSANDVKALSTLIQPRLTPQEISMRTLIQSYAQEQKYRAERDQFSKESDDYAKRDLELRAFQQSQDAFRQQLMRGLNPQMEAIQAYNNGSGMPE